MAKKRLLIVDDQIGIRSLLSVLFYEAGFEIFTASNGIEAIESVTKHQPFIVIMDLRMPGMGGIEAFSKIKKIDESIKVVLMSAFAEEETAKYIVTKGVDGFFHKPFDLQDLKRYVLELTNDNDCQANMA